MRSATELYGPNGDAVAAHIARCKTLSSKEWKQLSDVARLSYGTQTSTAARVWDAVVDAKLSFAWQKVIETLWEVARQSHGGRSLSEWILGFSAAANAGCGLSVRHIIASKDFDALYGPWASVMDADNE